MSRHAAFVAGVGMTPFCKPGSRDWDYPQMVREAGAAALADAGITYEDVDQAVAGYVYGESTSGQRALYELGMTGIPILNVNNNCATGSSALFTARQLVEGGMAECVLAVGFEKMQPGSLGVTFTDREIPVARHVAAMAEMFEFTTAPPTAQLFGNAAREHMARHGSTPEHYAWIGWKNHKHSVHNPNAQFRREYSIEEIAGAPMVHDPLTRLQCSPTSDGAAAVVVVSKRMVERLRARRRAVEILGQAMVTDTQATFADHSAISLVGAQMTRLAALEAYEKARVGPDDIQVIELHDCFSANELISYESLGLCDEGEGHKLVDNEETTYGGRWVVNPSGGLISKGHPLGATGLAQCAELTWQLRGDAGERQVEGARVALQHNIGLGGAAVVSIYGLGARP